MTGFFANYGPLLISMLLAATLALSLYVPLMAGQLSLASPGFYALGGYVAAVMSTRLVVADKGGFVLTAGWLPTIRFAGPLFPAGMVLAEMVVAAVLAALLAVLVGVPALRLRGIYLALATIGFVEVTRVVSLNLQLTGGAVGIFNIPQPFRQSISYAALALPLLVASALFVFRLERVRAGRAMAAIREDELAAAAMGIDVTMIKVRAFALGAMLAGMAGAISAHFLNTWNARQGTFEASVAYLAFVLIGGSRTVAGPIVGALLLTALPEVLRGLGGMEGMPVAVARLFIDGRLILYGLLLVIGPIFFPQGLIRPARRRTGGKRTATPQPEPVQP
ncbi:MAG: branched-chain amino acid ABC transporter permease [Herpetosiphon sp.]